jgi:uncharacterized protein YkuJ
MAGAVYVPKYPLSFFRGGGHLAGELIARKTFRQSVKFTAALPFVIAKSRTVWEAERLWTFTKNGVPFCTVNFPSGGDPGEDGLYTGTVVFDGDEITFDDGDILRLFAPDAVDATGADCSFDAAGEYVL